MSSKQQFQLFRFILALGISLGISMLIIFLVSKEPWTAISYLLLGPFGSMRHFLSIFAQATPLPASIFPRYLPRPWPSV